MFLGGSNTTQSFVCGSLFPGKHRLLLRRLAEKDRPESRIHLRVFLFIMLTLILQSRYTNRDSRLHPLPLLTKGIVRSRSSIGRRWRIHHQLDLNESIPTWRRCTVQPNFPSLVFTTALKKSSVFMSHTTVCTRWLVTGECYLYNRMVGTLHESVVT